MNKSLSIIMSGLGIATLGFLATVLLILGVSSLFIGKLSQAGLLLLASIFSFFFFYRWLDPFLSKLEKRFDHKPL